MKRILITEPMHLPAVDHLRARHEVLYEPTLVDEPKRLLDAAANVDALIVRNRTQVRGELLGALGRCRVVGRLGVGLDNLDMAGCEARGIVVIPATGANAAGVAEYVIASAMLLLRRVFDSTGAVAAGQWPRAALARSHEIAGKTMGLVGFGDIGRHTAVLARALGMRVLAWQGRRSANDPLYSQAGVAALPLPELLASADVVSVSLPLTDETRGLLGPAQIAAMKPAAVLVNTARGGIVDEAALVAALRGGALAGAALDVFDVEPLPPSPQFEGVPNLWLTPHVAGSSVESIERVGWMVARGVEQALTL